MRTRPLVLMLLALGAAMVAQPGSAAPAKAAAKPAASKAPPAETAPPVQKAPAEPPKWASCYLETAGGAGTAIALLVFEPFPVAADKSVSNGVGLRFDRDVGVTTVVAGYHPFASFSADACKEYRTEEEARERFTSRTTSRGYSIIKIVSWTPPAELTGIGAAHSSATVTGTGKSRGPAPDSAVTVTKADTSAKDAAKAWDEQVKKTLAAEAQKKVETAAKAVQADAKQKAQIEAFFAERRRQGRAQ